MLEHTLQLGFLESVTLIQNPQESRDVFSAPIKKRNLIRSLTNFVLVYHLNWTISECESS